MAKKENKTSILKTIGVILLIPIVIGLIPIILAFIISLMPFLTIGFIVMQIKNFRTDKIEIREKARVKLMTDEKHLRFLYKTQNNG